MEPDLPTYSKIWRHMWIQPNAKLYLDGICVIISFSIRTFLVSFLINQKFDWITNELRMFFDNFFDPFLFFIFNLILFQVKNNFGTAANGFSISVIFDCARTTSIWLPDILKYLKFRNFRDNVIWRFAKFAKCNHFLTKKAKPGVDQTYDLLICSPTIYHTATEPI